MCWGTFSPANWWPRAGTISQQWVKATKSSSHGPNFCIGSTTVNWNSIISYKMTKIPFQNKFFENKYKLKINRLLSYSQKIQREREKLLTNFFLIQSKLTRYKAFHKHLENLFSTHDQVKVLHVSCTNLTRHRNLIRWTNDIDNEISLVQDFLAFRVTIEPIADFDVFL